MFICLFILHDVYLLKLFENEDKQRIKYKSKFLSLLLFIVNNVIHAYVCF